jgi:hypothetical protein
MALDACVSSPDIVDALRCFSGALQIVHHIPGRIRLKLAPRDLPHDLAGVIDKAKRLGETLTNTSAVRSVTLNPLARSCVVEYDPQSIPPSAWTELINGTLSVSTERLLRGLAGAQARPE